MTSRSRPLTWMIFGIFFVISLLSNIVGPLVPEIIRSFGLSLTMAAFLPFSFFAAYAAMSIPAGVLTERLGQKIVILGAFTLAFLGSLLFALLPIYPSALLSLFLIGLGMAALQVTINPLLRLAGGEEHFAFNAVVVQVVYGLASFLSPLLYSHFAEGQDPLFARLVPANLPWVAIYWVFSIIAGLMLLGISFVPLPPPHESAGEKTGAFSAHLELAKRPVVWAYFLGIFMYVGLEQGLNNWMGQFLKTQHGFDPQTAGATVVSHFWLLMTFGAVLGLVLLKLIDSRRVLLLFSAASVVILSMALFGGANVAYYSFSALGFSVSVIWSIVFSLALNSVHKHHGTFSGILCTGVVGGALVPLLIGSLGDSLGLKAGLCLLYIPLAYILSMAFWARPLINNQIAGEASSPR